MSHQHRLHLKTILPLELWDLLTPYGSLWECHDHPDFPHLLVQAIAGVRAGTARGAGGYDPPGECRRIDFLFVAGGGTRRPGLVEALGQGPLPFHVSPEGAFTGTAGGFALLRQAGLTGMVVDVGQTAIKLSGQDQRLQVARDFARLPLAPVPQEQLEASRHALRGWLADAIRDLLGRGETTRPDGMVLALPCALDAHGVPGPCSYAGLEGDTALVDEVLRLAGWEGVTVLLLNDAELAAVSARLSPHVPTDRTTLVLTLGFGVGAALLLPGEGDVF